MFQQIKRIALITLFSAAIVHVGMHAADGLSQPTWGRRLYNILRNNAGNLTVLATLAAIAGGYYYDQDLRDRVRSSRFDRIDAAHDAIREDAHDLKAGLDAGVQQLAAGQSGIKREVSAARMLVQQELAEQKARDEAMLAQIADGFHGVRQGQVGLAETLSAHEAAAIARNEAARELAGEHYGVLMAQHEAQVAAREEMEHQLAEISAAHAGLSSQLDDIARVTVPNEKDIRMALQQARKQLAYVQAQKHLAEQQMGQMPEVAAHMLSELSDQERQIQHSIARAQEFARSKRYSVKPVKNVHWAPQVSVAQHARQSAPSHKKMPKKAPGSSTPGGWESGVNALADAVGALAAGAA